ncbi:hypothetical protein B7L70_10320 [Vulcanisaeta sp. EB80]|uniref:hypothetical protein n=1 Tax=Vulcanisaeta sp. EB80 TaxID=1650660 RepID=UPI0009BCF3F1|nr:hypothetical protein [Vulcanisaeta sp. EB80]PLC65645.1 hypothetical protein B7L70_10320 [Vulcanisaeta sp. EB80]
MGRVVARVSGPQKPEDVLLDVFALSFLTIIIAAYTANVGLYLSIVLGVIDGVLFIMMLRRIVTATFTVDGLIIERGDRRGRVFIPRDVVVAGNVVCIEWDPRDRSYNMRVAYGGRVYTISLMNKRLVDKMVDRLRRNWGWTPPECPN